MVPPPSNLYTTTFLLALLTTLLLALSLRTLAILRSTRTRTPPRIRPRTARLLVVLGSGGHTHEMLALLRDLDTDRYAHRTYVVSSGDAFSALRAVGFEKNKMDESVARTRNKNKTKTEEDEDKNKNKTHKTARNVGPEFYTIATIPRARRVHQPLYTTPLSALASLRAAFALLTSRELPHLIITNGPATAVVVVLAALVLRFFDVRGADSSGLCRTIYVESFARVKSLSLSGRLLVPVVDRFLVQWEELEGYGGRAEYCGILV